MQLVPGKFYVARSGDIWCCFNVDRKLSLKKIGPPFPRGRYGIMSS